MRTSYPIRIKTMIGTFSLVTISLAGTSNVIKTHLYPLAVVVKVLLWVLFWIFSKIGRKVGTFVSEHWICNRNELEKDPEMSRLERAGWWNINQPSKIPFPQRGKNWYFDSTNLRLQMKSKKNLEHWPITLLRPQNHKFSEGHTDITGKRALQLEFIERQGQLL